MSSQEFNHNNRLKNKAMIYQCLCEFRHIRANTVDEFAQKYWLDEATWQGFHPIDTLCGRQAIADSYLKPYKTSFPNADKHIHFLFAGEFDGKEWVATGGNLVGNFMEPFLGIPATKLCTWVRFAEIFEIKDGKIADSKMIFDLMSLLSQAGYKFLPAIGPEIIIPGPATNDGLILDASDPGLSQKSLQLIEDMLFKGLAGGMHKMEKTIIPDDKTIEPMRKYWHEDMIWYGPDTIGTGKGIDGWQFIHELPWQISMTNIDGCNHFARFAENNFVVSGGYPSIYFDHTDNEILGLPASNKRIEARDFNFWRVEDDLIIEDWCIIDMAHVLYQMGFDVLKKVREDRHYFRVNRGSVL